MEIVLLKYFSDGSAEFGLNFGGLEATVMSMVKTP